MILGLILRSPSAVQYCIYAHNHPSCRLANENAMKEVQTKMREIQKENDELNSTIAKKERECEIKTEEKDELMTTLNKIKDKLEKEMDKSDVSVMTSFQPSS